MPDQPGITLTPRQQRALRHLARRHMHHPRITRRKTIADLTASTVDSHEGIAKPFNPHNMLPMPPLADLVPATILHTVPQTASHSLSPGELASVPTDALGHNIVKRQGRPLPTVTSMPPMPPLPM